MPCAIMSKPPCCAHGPVWPKPEMEATTSRGLAARSASHPKPARARAPGRKFSTSTSARAISFHSTDLSASALRSSATERLLRFHSAKGCERPSTKGGMRRASSPSGRSTLITSAPRSPSIIVQ